MLIEIRDVPLTEAYGSSECDGTDTIWLNANVSADRFYFHVARHEMFHLAGAEHGGNEDDGITDLGGFPHLNPPSMATCIDWTTFSDVGTLHPDDEAYAAWLHSDLEIFRELHPNAGFEFGRSWWGWAGGSGTSLTWKDAGGQTGPGHVSWAPVGTSYVFNTSVIWTGDDNESYTPRTAARSLSSDWKAIVNPTLWRRTLGASLPNDCDYPDGVPNPNDPGVTSNSWVKIAEQGDTGISSTWQTYSPAFVTPTGTMGMAIQLRIFGSSINRDTGESGKVLLDNATGMGT